LEEEMLDEVRSASPVGPLVAGAHVDPEAERDGAHARNPLGDDALARIELAEDDLLHARMVGDAYARATKRRTEPSRLASYCASSARRNSVCGSAASLGHEAHPKLALRSAAHGAPSATSFPSSPSTRAITCRASSSVASARSTANSSPPIRNAWSGLRRASTRTFANATSASSPAACP